MTGDTRRWTTGRLLWLWCVAIPAGAAAAELEPETVTAYERYIAEVEKRFGTQATSDDYLWLDAWPAEERERLREGDILAGPGQGDGIMSVPDGLIHHWWGAAFIPDVTLAEVLDVSRAYADYQSVYDYIIGSGVVAEEKDRYWVYLRLERDASLVTAIVDLWTYVEYDYPRNGRATAISNADCARHVENAGGEDERRLAPDRGSGYIWRANTLSRYLERDGGVYVELQTVGLSRPFPPLLGWLIEPIARGLGRGSAEESLAQLRRAVVTPEAAVEGEAPAVVEVPSFWCTPEQKAAE